MILETNSFILYHALDELLHGKAKSELFQFTEDELKNAKEVHAMLARATPSNRAVTVKW